MVWEPLWFSCRSLKRSDLLQSTTPLVLRLKGNSDQFVTRCMPHTIHLKNVYGYHFSAMCMLRFVVCWQLLGCLVEWLYSIWHGCVSECRGWLQWKGGATSEYDLPAISLIFYPCFGNFIQILEARCRRCQWFYSMKKHFYYSVYLEIPISCIAFTILVCTDFVFHLFSRFRNPSPPQKKRTPLVHTQ